MSIKEIYHQLKGGRREWRPGFATLLFGFGLPLELSRILLRTV
jgi:hypothetical protein